MSGYRRYPKYRDSGVEWIGEVPEGWTEAPLKSRLTRNDGGVWGKDPDGVEDTVVLRSTEQCVDGTWNIEEPAFRKLSVVEVQAGRLEVGDLVVTKSSGSELHIGKTSLVTPGVAALNACYSNFMQRLRVDSRTEPRFVHYCMNNKLCREQFTFLSNTTSGLANLNGTILGTVRMAFPEHEGQIRIADFLDDKTARIDALIAKKTRFIALLQEKRQALITHAVTKGLDPKAKMKDSGVEWIGEVPEGWDVTALKRLGTLKGGSGFPIEMQGRSGNELPFYKVGDLAKSADGRYLGSTEHSINKEEAAELRATVFQKNTLVWAKIGAALFLNRKRITNVTCCLDNNMTGFTISLGTAQTLFAYYLVTALDFGVYAKPGAVPSLPEGEQAEIRVTLPPPTEQTAIAAYLDHATARIDNLVSLTARSVTLLQEKRSALITAAVTGQIDVREEVSVEAPEELAA